MERWRRKGQIQQRSYKLTLALDVLYGRIKSCYSVETAEEGDTRGKVSESAMTTKSLRVDFGFCTLLLFRLLITKNVLECHRLHQPPVLAF